MTRTKVFHTAVFISLPLFLVAGIVALVFYATNSAHSHRSVHTTSATPITTTSRAGKAQAASTSSSSSSSTTSSTTTTQPAVVAEESTTTTTTTPAFTVSASATKTAQNIDFCSSNTFTFTPDVHANRAGSATYVWVRSDGNDSGVSGSITFDASGNPTAIVPAYTLSLPYSSPMSGWVQLDVTYAAGTASSGHVAYSYTFTPSSYIPSGC